jgi:hypothetical protein
MVKSAPMPVPDSKSLQVFQSLLVSGPPEPAEYGELLAALEAEQHLEHALALLRHARPDLVLWGPALAQLKEAAGRSRTRRMSLWQVDPHRRTLRLRFEVLRPACGLNPPALVASLARLLMDAGLPVAMGLEKNPRPAVQVGHPLPLDVEGWREWADAVLQEGPGLPLEALPAHLNGFAPEGLRVLQCALVPNFASPVSDLCRQGHWQWPCPEALLEHARERVAAFETATCFEVERPGKVEGQKIAKRVDIRALLGGLAWDGPRLGFETRIGPGQAANPRKLLAGILGVAPEDIQGLARTEVDLRPDPRLLHAEKFTPKLHNMFEDAVLLNSGSNIRIVEEDDEDPLILG